MIKNSLHISVQPNIDFPSLSKEQTVKSILGFLKTYLPQFNTEFLLADISVSKEDDISRELLYFLQDKIENLLIHFDAKEGVDFVMKIKPFIMKAEAIFLIEAKRLPPTNNKDYVQGNTGGMERFKRELSSYGKHLTYSAMIGYIQKNSKDYWNEKINNWVGEKIIEESDLKWGENDKLKPDIEFADFISQHSRITQSPILFYITFG